MTSDPRPETLSRLTTSGRFSENIVAALDREDPLRLALREPSPYMDEMAHAAMEERAKWLNPDSYGAHRAAVRAILAALWEAVTPDV